MHARMFGMTFQGYWRDEHEQDLPSLSGVYCVYVCVDHPDTKEVQLTELIYIGETNDIRASIAIHEKHPLWKTHGNPGTDICYSYALVDPQDRERCAAALIFQHQPRDNQEYRLAFPFGDTSISLLGQIRHLTPNFTIAHDARRAQTN